ncbi:MAG: NAD(P)/FAD-dependent oxidoreductase [Flavisolibacter sp.]|nr:NAD(P)/FAD-dependent oxidoreductase [Flavisolibacter sp.]MBD0295549.1 NAD(P)/FAD-dependent oxidoreductase [Flavisolibacter sp.]MBD0351473.1 NAD(P)/FAD-dependent oxidoreductase [Flavisolibacter sp.]MBD0376179.1 NAD(P)/FAD-dependent oxidoreductase [Flavisolibacter sp.]
MMEIQDCIIVGGGPAGLNAAVVLGRCRRKVLLFDTAQYRNRYSHGMHNYLTRDDILPMEFIKICHQEIKKYGIGYIPKKVVRARKNDEGVFVVRDEEGTVYYAKKLLIATGLSDTLPEVEGFSEMYGKSIHHCPYCDGWEVRDKKLGVYARNKEGWELALNLKAWSEDVTLFTDGKNKVKPFQKELLDANNIEVIKWSIARLKGTDGKLEAIIFKNGEERLCEALFFVNGYTQQCDIAETFDCEISNKGVVMTNRFQQTQTPGLFIAGDADKDMHFVVVAAAEGAKAGVVINKELQKEICEHKMQPVQEIK